MSALWEREGMNSPCLDHDPAGNDEPLKFTDGELKCAFHTLWTKAGIHSKIYRKKVWSEVRQQLWSAGLDV